jgi:squalene-hopene/tetraprenyl-beta-curcumene cyclase
MLHVPVVLVLSAAVAVAQSAPATQKPSAPPAAVPAPQAPLSAPEVPLDARVDTSKITKVSPPALPSSLVQPVPVTHRIAERAEQVPISAESFKKAKAAIDSGLAYLRRSQRPSGAWMERELVQPTDQPRASAAAAAATALAVKAFLQAGQDDANAQRGLQFVVKSLENGGYDGLANGGVGTYVASAVVSALATAQDPRFEDFVRQGVAWLKATQWDQSEGLAPEQDWFGGAGYGRNKRPDLSNTQMMLDAMYDAGVSPSDPAVQKALAFVQRAQNLPSKNDAAWAKAGTGDGGFIYTPANGGESFASEVAGEGRFGEKFPEGTPRSLRSYGSMTYAGFKSLLYAGLSKDDERVRAAFEWISKHYTFDENPGLKQEGLYYYLHAMARALFVSQQPTIPSVAGDGTVTPRNWREDLIAAIASRQQSDGSWVNKAERWEEGQPDLVTVYSLLALEEAIKPTLTTE